MKPITETHPSLKGKEEISSLKYMKILLAPEDSDRPYADCFFTKDVQKHTVDKQVIKTILESYVTLGWISENLKDAMVSRFEDS